MVYAVSHSIKRTPQRHVPVVGGEMLGKPIARLYVNGAGAGGLRRLYERDGAEQPLQDGVTLGYGHLLPYGGEPVTANGFHNQDGFGRGGFLGDNLQGVQLRL